MAKAIENHLGDRPAAFHRLEPGLIIDRLGEAQQGALLVGRIAAQQERAGSGDRRLAERKRGIDHPGLAPDRLELFGRRPARRLHERGRPGWRDRREIGRCGRRPGHHDPGADCKGRNAHPGKSEGDEACAAAPCKTPNVHAASPFGEPAGWARRPSTSSRGPSARILPPSMTISRSRMESMLCRCVATTSDCRFPSAFLRCSMK